TLLQQSRTRMGSKICSAVILLLAVTLLHSNSCYGNPALHVSSKDRIAKGEKPLSDLPHNEDPLADDHKFDHEAFLGHEDSEKFDQMTPEQSTAALAKIVDKIDKDGDGFVTQQEMYSWIDYIAKRYVRENSKRQFNDYSDGKEDAKIDWDTYKTKVFGPSPGPHTTKTIERERRRWQRADRDADGLLSLAEFTDFAHPEEAAHMRELVALESLEDLDRNGDGAIDEAEYIGDMWSGKDSGEPEPDWVQQERDTFRSQRDANKDGKLDLAEVSAWILPTNYDQVDAETKHLFSQADLDKDGRLSKQEILDHHDIFAGSQATDFGEALRNHEEL
uniref:Reticulocalbin-3 n=2 Tax=Macrostomum lignano TaxID=282301 RepID=A0A1I8H5M9_9PLAT